MKRLCILLLLAAFSDLAAFAQRTDPVATFVSDALAKHTPGMIAAAKAMPADKFAMKGPPDEMTFGYLILHIADANYVFCSLIGGVPEPGRAAAADTDPKPQLVDRMRSSFDFCATALAKLDDSHMSQQLAMPDRSKLSRAMAVLTLAGSWSTHDQQLQTYLKLGETSAGPR